MRPVAREPPEAPGAVPVPVAWAGAGQAASALEAVAPPPRTRRRDRANWRRRASTSASSAFSSHSPVNGSQRAQIPLLPHLSAHFVGEFSGGKLSAQVSEIRSRGRVNEGIDENR